MDNIIQILKDYINTNVIVSGGLIVIVFTTLFQYIKSLPSLIYRYLERFIFFRCDLRNTDEAYVFILKLLEDKCKNNNLVEIITSYNSLFNNTPMTEMEECTGDVEENNNKVLTFIPGDGNHFILLEKIPVLISKRRIGANASNNLKDKENIQITTLVFYKERLKNLLSEKYKQQINNTLTYNFINSTHDIYWTSDINPREKCFEKSIILKQGVLETIIKDIEFFKTNKKWYNTVGIPYHKGWLLYGPPGCGKTSTIQAIADHFNYNIFYLNLNNEHLNDFVLKSLLQKVHKGIIVIEDIDSHTQNNVNKRKEENNDIDKITSNSRTRFSFSMLLNCLCGIHSTDGNIIFMTTNYKENLDPALIRPGRIDNHILIDYPDEDQVKRLFLKFYPDKLNEATSFSLNVKDKKISMADLQRHLLKTFDNINKAINYEEEIKIEE